MTIPSGSSASKKFGVSLSATVLAADCFAAALWAAAGARGASETTIREMVARLAPAPPLTLREPSSLIHHTKISPQSDDEIAPIAGSRQSDKLFHSVATKCPFGFLTATYWREHKNFEDVNEEPDFSPSDPALRVTSETDLTVIQDFFECQI